MLDSIVNQIVFLGDSLTDNGNFLNITGGGFPNTPFYSPGSFSNGSAWSEYLASELGLNLVPFTAASYQNLEGINFAIGGATSGSRNLGLPISAGLKEQVDALTGMKENQLVNSDTVYSLWSGTNDYLGLNLSSAQTKKNAKNIVKQTVTNLKTTLTTLIEDMDAQHIMVFNIPDLSQTPFGTKLQADANKTLKTLTSEHNKELNKELKSLSKAFRNVDIIPVDINSLFKKITKNPTSFGFTNINEAATNTNIYDPTFQLDPSKLVIRSNPNDYMFWDNVHPTTKAHKIIADYVVDILEANQNSFTTNNVLTLTTQSNRLSNNTLSPVTANNSLSLQASSTTANPILLNLNPAGQVLSTQNNQVRNERLEQPVNELFFNQVEIPVFQLNFANN